MANIADYLNKILKSVYGKDVRQAIHDAIHQCYEDGNAGSIDLVARENIDLANKRIDNITANANVTDGNSELVDIRIGYDGTEYNSAGEAVRGQFDNLKGDLSNLSDEIKELKFETDSTLSIAGKSADAKSVGDLLRVSQSSDTTDTSIWEIGTISMGENTNSPSRFRTVSYVDSKYESVSTLAGYEMYLAVYDKNGVFVGRISSTGIDTTGTLLWVTEFAFSEYPDYQFRIVLRNANDTEAAMTVSEANNVVFYGYATSRFDAIEEEVASNQKKIEALQKSTLSDAAKELILALFNNATYISEDMMTAYNDLVYELTGALYMLKDKTFDGTAAGINTGIQLLSNDIDFTIVAYFIPNFVSGEYDIFRCLNKVSPYNGVLLTYDGNLFYMKWIQARQYTSITADNTKWIRCVYRHRANSNTAQIAIKQEGGTTETYSISSEYEEITANFSVCGTISGSIVFYGIMYHLAIYPYVFTSEQVTEYLAKAGDSNGTLYN